MGTLALRFGTTGCTPLVTQTIFTKGSTLAFVTTVNAERRRRQSPPSPDIQTPLAITAEEEEPPLVTLCNHTYVPRGPYAWANVTLHCTVGNFEGPVRHSFLWRFRAFILSK